MHSHIWQHQQWTTRLNSYQQKLDHTIDIDTLIVGRIIVTIVTISYVWFWKQYCKLTFWFFQHSINWHENALSQHWPLKNFCVLTSCLWFTITVTFFLTSDIFTNDSNPRQDVFLGRSWTVSEWTPGSARLGLPLLAMLWSLCPLRPTLTARTLPLILLTSQIPPLIGQDPDWRVILASDWTKAVTGFGPDLGHICWHCLAWAELLGLWTTLDSWQHIFVLFCENIN